MPRKHSNDNKTSNATVQGAIAELVRLKKVAFNDKKVSYALKVKK
jgi:hypothetical protein